MQVSSLRSCSSAYQSCNSVRAFTLPTSSSTNTRKKDNYSSHYKDSIYIKVTVYGIFILDILQSIIIAALGYYSLVTGWGRPTALNTLNWAFTSIPIVTGISELLLHNVYLR